MTTQSRQLKQMTGSFSADGHLLMVGYGEEGNYDYEAYRFDNFIEEGLRLLPAVTPHMQTRKLILTTCYWTAAGDGTNFAMVFENTPSTFEVWEGDGEGQLFRPRERLVCKSPILGLKLFLCSVLVVTCNEISIHCVNKNLTDYIVRVTPANADGVYAFGAMSMNKARPVVAYPGKRAGEFHVMQLNKYKRRYEGRKILSHCFKIEALAICSTYNLVASTCAMGERIRVYTIESGIKLYELYRETLDWTFLTKELSFSANGKYLIADSGLMGAPLLHVYNFEEYHLTNPLPTRQQLGLRFGPFKRLSYFPGLRGRRISAISAHEHLLVACENGFFYTYYLPTAENGYDCHRFSMRYRDERSLTQESDAPPAYDTLDFSETAGAVGFVMPATSSVAIQAVVCTADVATSPLDSPARDANIAASFSNVPAKGRRVREVAESLFDVPSVRARDFHPALRRDRDADVAASLSYVPSVRAGDAVLAASSSNIPTKVSKTKVPLISSLHFKERYGDVDVAPSPLDIPPSDLDVDVDASSSDDAIEAGKTKVALILSLEFKASDRDAAVAPLSLDIPPSDRDADTAPSLLDFPRSDRHADLAPLLLDFPSSNRDADALPSSLFSTAAVPISERTDVTPSLAKPHSTETSTSSPITASLRASPDTVPFMLDPAPDTTRFVGDVTYSLEADSDTSSSLNFQARDPDAVESSPTAAPADVSCSTDSPSAPLTAGAYDADIANLSPLDSSDRDNFSTGSSSTPATISTTYTSLDATEEDVDSIQSSSATIKTGAYDADVDAATSSSLDCSDTD